MSASRLPGPRGHLLSRGLHLYLGGEILKAFLVVMLGFEAVLGSIFCFGAVRNYGVDLTLLLPVLGPALAAYLDAVIPVSLLFSTALVYGRLIADREVAAMKGFGLSYLELALPPLALGCALGVVVLLLNFFAIPELRFTRDNLGRLILDRLRYLEEDQNQSFDLGTRHTLWIERIQGQKLEGVFIASEEGGALGLQGIDPRGEEGVVESLGYPIFLYAAEGEVVKAEPGGRDLAIELRGVTVYYDSEYLKPEVRSDFKHRIDLGRLRLPVRIDQADRNDKELKYPALRQRIVERRGLWDAARAAGAPAADVDRARLHYYGAVTELHRRIAFGVVGLTFPLAAAALALFLNSPNRLVPVFVSLMVATPVYYLLEMHGNAWGRAGHVPWLMEELGNVGLCALSAGLFLALRWKTLW